MWLSCQSMAAHTRPMCSDSLYVNMCMSVSECAYMCECECVCVRVCVCVCVCECVCVKEKERERVRGGRERGERELEEGES